MIQILFNIFCAKRNIRTKSEAAFRSRISEELPQSVAGSFVYRQLVADWT